ncbi:sialate O-acetylesterase [Mesorhizobium sp. B2-7-2]|uniref:sialate O-acetylesterase n=1 Tax=Mesorhizobium sp. B2-7-2 TaxID=2589908 RepID=UPI001FEE514C|nr:sialate O-acetylesterase [Mesorhizobium sp. B2-7-2]
MRLATTANNTLYALQTIDGVAAEVGDRVLVKDQADQTQNGIYTASEGQWFRAADARTARTMQKGTTVHVQEGLVSVDRVYAFETLDPVIGADPIVLSFYLSQDTLGGAVNAANAAAASAAAALTSKNAAATSATNAAGSATAASGSASAALTSATAAAGSASTASTAATNAGNSATAAAGSASSAAASAAAAAALPGITTDPIVILATGQSNIGKEENYLWTPPTNLYNWNYSGVDGTTGTAFAALDGTKINTSYSFAAAIAENNPLRKVYLVRVGLLVPPNGIAQWKAGASSPDQYANCKSNVEAALTLLGRSKISHMLWWQGEGDIATPTTYQTDFETVQTRFRGETWYPRELPVTICGLMPEVLGGTSGKDVMNTVLQQCAQVEPETRQFVYPGWTSAAMWQDTAHPTGAGCWAIGRAIANNVIGRTGAKPASGLLRNFGTAVLSYLLGKFMLGYGTSVAVGATSASAPQFQSHGTDAGGAQGNFYRWANSVGGSTIGMFKSRGTSPGARAIVQNGDTLATVIGYGDDGVNAPPAASISIVVDGTPGVGDMPGKVKISTTSDGAAAVTDRVTVDNRGFMSMVSGSFGRSGPVTKSADFTVGDAENSIIVTKGSSCVATLPSASSWLGREILIKTTVAFTTVSASANVVPLAGGAAGTAILAATAGKWALLISDGTNWVVQMAA